MPAAAAAACSTGTAADWTVGSCTREAKSRWDAAVDREVGRELPKEASAAVFTALPISVAAATVALSAAESWMTFIAAAVSCAQATQGFWRDDLVNVSEFMYECLGCNAAC